MIQVNLLLPTAGRSADCFVMNDLTRFPLGILTGVGFIGAGAIIHRDNIVIGVTTAATLRYVTVIGLRLGGGRIWLGSRINPWASGAEIHVIAIRLLPLHKHAGLPCIDERLRPL
jgi:hypothetical protein